jgi:hypothetical protein
MSLNRPKVGASVMMYQRFLKQRSIELWRVSMPPLNKKLNQLLLDLAWSLWTELGVAGVKRKHQKFLITPEEFILLTVALAEIDPRLRDESLDWCSQYHHFISVSRLKSIMKSFGSSLNEHFSSYSATLNSVSQASWPLFLDSTPLKFIPSHKSCLRPLQSPGLLNIRARSMFGTGARADLVTFFLTHAKSDFAASDVTEIGYSKRNLAIILEEFCLSGLFDKFSMRNQQRYRLIKNDQLIKVLGSIPDYAPSWRLIFEVLLLARDCIKRTENSSESTRVVEIRNLLQIFQKNLQKLRLTPPHANQLSSVFKFI